MKILVIFTGGTISCTNKNGFLSPSANADKSVIDEYRKANGNDIEFEAIKPFTVLSENLCAETLNTLINTVYEKINQGYDKIIICHGTDTLRFSAAALAFSLSGRGAGIVLVSSNYPLNDKRSNGVENFVAAVEFLKIYNKDGVFVSYKNNGDNAKILLASRLLAGAEEDDGIYESSARFAAQMINGKIEISEDCNIPKCRKSEIIKFCEPSQIAVLESAPSSSPCVDLSRVKAVIFKPYHSGTLCTESTALADFCRAAHKNGVSLLVANARDTDIYESAREFDRLKIVPVPNCTLASLYIKAWLAVSAGKDIPSFVQKEIYGEFQK